MAMRTLDPGLQIGKYEIVVHIASGGMGAVYKATDRELRRTVALKVLPAHRAQSRRDLERFKREARHAARLSHPNIVTLYDYGYDEGEDVYYLALEFIDGFDLAHLIQRKGQLSPTETRGILIQAADALDHAHAQGLIHRDIKPSNFLLTKLRDKHVVKLADMGLAIVEDDDEFKVTREGKTVGTIDYMAPEQARDSRAADIRSDIYSLGCTAYHMLAGEAPFAEGGLGERVYKHMNVPPADVRQFNAGVSAGLWRIIDKMLAKAPEDRYATPADLRADLKRTPAEAGPDEPTELAPLPRKAQPPQVVNTPAPEQTLSADREPPRPKKKRPRPRGKIGGPSVGTMIGIGVGLCVVIVLGFILKDALKSTARRSGDPVEQTKGPVLTPVEKKPTSIRVPIEPPPDPAQAKLPVVVPLAPFKGHEWPGRQFVPFNAVAPRARMDEIKAVEVKGRIQLASNGAVLPMAMTWESLTRVKYQEGMGFAGLSVLLVGNHGWMIAGPRSSKLTGDLLAYCQNANYATILADLIPLTERAFDIDKGETTMIRNRECFSVQVRRADRPAVALFFDKQTSLLFKAEFSMRMLGGGLSVQPQPTRVELYFGNYQVIDGVNHWRTQEQWRDGKLFSELTLTDIRFQRRAADALFSSPGLDDAAGRALIDFRKEQVKLALAQVGSSPDSEITTLVRGLSLKEPSARWTVRDGVRAYAELWREDEAPALKGSDLGALSTLLLCSDDELPAFALEALAHLGPQAADAAPHLVTLGQSSGDAKILAGTIGALKSTAVKSDAALGLYVKLLDHPDAAVKNPAANALFQLGPERYSIDRLTALMAWPNAPIRADAGKLLRQRLATITPKDLPMLREGLRNPVREVKLAFIDALGSLKEAGRAGVNDLLPLLIGTDKELANRTVRALDQMGQLVNLARDNGDPAVMAAAINALHAQSLKTAEALAIYQMHLDHPKESVRNAAAFALIELGPERLDKARLIEFMSRARPVDLAATFALYKVDPGNAALKLKGVGILIKSLRPDVGDLKAFVDAPLRSRSAEVLLDIGGASAIVPAVKHLLSDNNPKSLAENQQDEPTAARLMGYTLLLKFAEKAKAKQDRALIAALQKQASSLNAFWYAEESRLANHLKKLPDVSAETKQLHLAAADSAYRAYRAIAALRAP